MKKCLLLAASLFVGCLLHATVYTIEVTNYQFSPATVNAAVGDTINWTWIKGDHTTTCDPTTQSGNSLPDGAATWNSPISSVTTSFAYVLTVPGIYNYWCIPHAAFGMVGVINAASVLPVTLLNFTATVTKNNKAFLQWMVAAEENVDHYTIQKSIDGKTFTNIAEVSSTQNLVSQKTYSYTDIATTASRYVYYTLQTVDKDGRSQLSPILLYKNEAVQAKIILSMSPNPVTSPGHLMLQFIADKPGTLTVQLYDMNGKLVVQDNMTAAAGVNNGHFHINEVTPGAYNIVFSIDGKKEIKKLLIE